MRVMLTSFAAPTHLFSMVPLGWALRAAGHDVCAAVQPSLVPVARDAGLTVLPVGADVELPLPTREDAEHRPFGNIDFEQFYDPDVDLTDLVGMFTVLVPTYVAGANDPLVPALVDAARDWRPDLVVWEPMTWAGALAARAVGARHARLLWGPDVLGRAVRTLETRSADLHPAHREHPLQEWLRWTAERAGVPYDDDLLYGEWTIEVEPPRFRLDTGLDVQTVGYVPYNGPAVVPEWLHEPPARPRVCFTLGVSARGVNGRDEVDPGRVLRSLCELDVEVVATLTPEQEATLGPRPRNLRVVPFVPLDALLPTCAAVVHHGGAGTWSTALRHGVPQVVLGHTWDAVLKARMIDRAGAGRYLDPGRTDGPALRDAVAEVLASRSVRAQAQALRGEVRAQPTPADAVAEIVARVGR